MVSISKLSKPESQVWIWIVNTCSPVAVSLVGALAGILYIIPIPRFVRCSTLYSQPSPPPPTAGY